MKKCLVILSLMSVNIMGEYKLLTQQGQSSHLNAQIIADTDNCTLQDLHVAKGHQGEGLGTAMLKKGSKTLDQAGCSNKTYLAATDSVAQFVSKKGKPLGITTVHI